MPDSVVVDASVFIKLIASESDSDQALTCIEKLIKERYQVLAPDLLRYEVIAKTALWCKRDQKVALDLWNDCIEGLSIRFFEPYDELVKSALNIVASCTLEKAGHPSFYDAIYHAIAIENACDFITADRRHHSKTKHLGHISLLADYEI